MLFVISILVIVCVLIPLNFESMYNYATFVAPIKNAHLDVLADHYDGMPVSSPTALFIHNIKLISDDSIEIQFGDNTGNTGYYEQVPKFSFTATIKEGQTFLDRCSAKHDLNKPEIGIYKYVGLALDDRNYELGPVFLFYHASGTIQSPMQCTFPQVIEHSIDVIQLDPKPDSQYHLIENILFEEESKPTKPDPIPINPEKEIPTFFEIMLMEQNIQWEMPQRNWLNLDFELEPPARVCSEIVNPNGTSMYISTVLQTPYTLSNMTFHSSLPDDCLKVLSVTQIGIK